MQLARNAEGLTIELASEDDTRRLGAALAELLEPGVVIGLVGPLGAGKTYLVRSIAEALGVAPAAISSPTFVLIHEYEGRLPVYHFDAYRLKSPHAFEELGPADYFGAGGVCLIEWADRVRELLPAGHWLVTLAQSGPAARSVRLELPPAAAGVAAALSRRLAAPQNSPPGFDAPFLAT
jgi:tRNA threonylcarbamoyladenosine biosynthesis protein TsaE